MPATDATDYFTHARNYAHFHEHLTISPVFSVLAYTLYCYVIASLAFLVVCVPLGCMLLGRHSGRVNVIARDKPIAFSGACSARAEQAGVFSEDAGFGLAEETQACHRTASSTWSMNLVQRQT